MNAKRAKRLRRAIYGDLAHGTREYVAIKIDKPIPHKPGYVDTVYTVLNHPASRRALYQAAKRNGHAA